MLTSVQIAAGTARLQDGRLTDDDVMKLVPVMRMFLGSLETKYSWDLEGGLRDLDDSSVPGKKAAQVAAGIIAMEGLGFGVSKLSGGRDGLAYSEKEDYGQYILDILAQMYAIPEELSSWDLRRRPKVGGKTGAIRTRRRENWC